MAKAVGIDLGTTFSEVAVMEGDEPKVIVGSEGQKLCPSVIAISKTGERLVGWTAKRQMIINPENTIYSIKRFMGKKFRDSGVEEDRRFVPYKVVEAPNGDVRVIMGGKEYSPQEISAMILQKLKTDAEAYLGEPVNEAVITVPAYFNDAQRQATKDAGEIAGLKVLRIINEPTASCLAYGLEKKKEGYIVVYDLGGGTLDVSILEVAEGTFQVKSTSGNTHLGGDNFDQVIMDWLIDQFKRDTGIDLRQDRMALQRLKDAAEKAKVELSSLYQTEINLPFITADATGPKHLNYTLTRAQLEKMTMHLVERTLEPCRQALMDAKLRPEQISEVLLVGGMTRMPLIQQKVREFFGREPSKGVNPDEAVALGAAIQAAVLKGEAREILLLDVTPLTLSVETLGGIATPIIPRNTTIPVKKSQIFTTAADGQTSVEIHVVQGERPMAADNKSLARFILDGIIPAPRGIPQIEVSFDIDANGILSVRARDLGTGREQKVIVHPSSGLTREEIERMKREAESFAREDARRRELVETRNQADSLIYSTEKMLREHSDKIPSHLRSEIEAQINSLRSVMSRDDAAAIRREIHQLSEIVQRAGMEVYKRTPPSEEGKKPPEGGTVEGEYREV